MQGTQRCVSYLGQVFNDLFFRLVLGTGMSRGRKNEPKGKTGREAGFFPLFLPFPFSSLFFIILFAKHPDLFLALDLDG